MLEKFKETKFYKGCVRLKNDMKPMTFKEKLEHLWMYYKEYLWVAGLIFVAISLVVTIITSRSKTTLVSGMMANITISQEGYNYLSTDYQEYLEGDKRHIVELDYTTFSDMLNPVSGEDSYYSAMIITARVSGGMLDYMLLDKFAMEYYIDQEVYMDLREFFTAEELAALDAEDRLITARQEGSTDAWVVAVDISGTAFAQTHISSEGGVYFALSGNTQRPEMCRNAWEYINAWQPEE